MWVKSLFIVLVNKYLNNSLSHNVMKVKRSNFDTSLKTIFFSETLCCYLHCKLLNLFTPKGFPIKE